MSTLISTAGLITLTDLTGAIYDDLVVPIDAAGGHARQIATQLVSVFATDVDQAMAWYPAARALYSGSAPVAATGLFAANSVASFGGGQGLLSRTGLLPSVMFGWLEMIRKQIQLYGSPVDARIVDIVSFAAYYNRSTPASLLFSPNFASAYWFGYSAARMLDAASVFAPPQVPMAVVTITAGNTATFTDTYPRANSYVNPPPTSDSYGNLVFAGGMPMAQGFAPPIAVEILVTANISGACAMTVTAPDQNGISRTWTATLDNLNAGGVCPLIPSSPGARIGGVITAVSIVGAASSGAATIQVAAAERSVR